MEDRPSWDDYYKELCIVTAKRSPCHRLHVGCLLVKDNRIIAQGYNGYLAGCPHEQIMRDGHEIGTVHAEQNAVAYCAKFGVNCDSATAYITHYPCINCMKILCASGISHIKYIDDYRNDPVVSQLGEMKCVTINKI
tara:strand:- start:2353 stop:2763 length:411 start_codon:yes stop_codon:yes gene_type:complete